MLTLARFQADAPLADVTAAMLRDGAAVIEGLVAGDDLAQLDRDCTGLLADTAASEGYFHGFKTKRVGAMVAKSSVCRTMALHPTILGVMDHFLKPHCSDYQLNLSHLIAIGPGEERQVTHADDQMFPFTNRDFQAMINVMWAVDEFTSENGGTHIAPGSHGWPRDRHPKEDEIAQAAMPPGSCLIYVGSVRHGGGANLTDRIRRGIVISYCLGWLRQSENQYLAIPLDVVRTMPLPLQRLLGYFVHVPNLGMVDGRDPMDILTGDASAHGFKDYLSEDSRKALEFYYVSKDIMRKKAAAKAQPS